MHWYEEDVKNLESVIAGLTYEPGLVFYGSSSIRLWDTLEEDFKESDALNMGFGGSTLAACCWYFNRLFSTLNPSSIIIYAGDNDLGDGRTPEEVLFSFKELTQLIYKHFGNIPVGYISIKPSLSRLAILDKIIYTNKLIEAQINKSEQNLFYIDVFNSMISSNGEPKTELLETDGLHINEKGYELWKNIISASLANENLNLQKAS